MRKVKAAQVGLGHHGYGLLKDIILDNPKCEVVAVCDLYDDRTKAGQDIVKEKQGNVPFGSVNHMATGQ